MTLVKISAASVQLHLIELNDIELSSLSARLTIASSQVLCLLISYRYGKSDTGILSFGVK